MYAVKTIYIHGSKIVDMYTSKPELNVIKQCARFL